MPRMGYVVPGGEQPALCGRCRKKFPASRLTRDGDNPLLMVCDEGCYDDPIKIPEFDGEEGLVYPWVQPESTGPGIEPATSPIDDDNLVPEWPYTGPSDT